MADADPKFYEMAVAATPACWTETAAARIAIAACIEAGLCAIEHRETFGRKTDYWNEYEGPLADAVEAAREAWLIEQGGGEGTTAYMRLHFEQPSVVMAIDDARMSVPPVCATVSQGNTDKVARLLDVSRPIDAAEWAQIEGGL